MDYFAVVRSGGAGNFQDPASHSSLPAIACVNIFIPHHLAILQRTLNFVPIKLPSTCMAKSHAGLKSATLPEIDRSKDYPVRLGDTFSESIDATYHSLQYKFKPKSAGKGSGGRLQIDQNTARPPPHRLSDYQHRNICKLFQRRRGSSNKNSCCADCSADPQRPGGEPRCSV